MATTVSERPQTRRSSTGWSNRWLLGSLAVVATLFAASASKFVWATFVVAFIFLFGLSRWLKPAALPKQEETAPLTMPLHKSSIRPFERPNDWVDRMGRLTGSVYRTSRHSATGTYHMGRDTVAPAIGRGVVRFGAMLRERLVPKLVSTASWVFAQLARVSTRTWLIIGGGFGLFVGAGLVTLMLRGDISDAPAIPTAIAMLAGSVGLMMLISRIGAPYYPDESLPEEGGLVMNESNDNAQDHGEEVPTSPSVPADDGVERTSKNLGTREERHARLSEMFAQQQRVTEPTVQMTPSEHAEVWEGSRFASVMTAERPAPAPEVEWPSAPPAVPLDLNWDDGDDGVVATGSMPLEGVTPAAHFAAEASNADDTGDLPKQAEVDEDTTPEPIARSHIVWIVPVIGVIVSVVFWLMYLSLDGPFSIAFFCGALLFFSATYWEELIELVYAKLNKTSAGFSEWIKGKFFSQGNLITLASLAGVLLISVAVVSYGVLKSEWEWASVWGHIATAWSPLWTIISFPFGSVERFYYTLLFFSLVRIAWVAGDRSYNKLRFEDGMIRFNRGLVFTKKRAVRASSVVNCEFDPPNSMWPLNKVGTLSVPYKEAMEGSFPSQIRRFPAKGYPTVQRYVSEND